MSFYIHDDIQRILAAQKGLVEDGLSIYALADAARDKFFLSKWMHLLQRNLLTEAAGEKAAQISPHLIQLNTEITSLEWTHIQKRVLSTPKMTLIVSPLNFEEMYAHLRQFTTVRFDGGLEMFLAFWDPCILATLLGHQADKTLYMQEQVLDNEQKQILLSPIHTWSYWDRLGQLQQINGLNLSGFQRSFDSQNPLCFSVEQEEQMVEATFPDHLIYYLKLNNYFLVENFSAWDLYEYVISALKQARSFDLQGTRDILNFICLKLGYQERFEIDQQLQTALLQVKEKQITMDQAMEMLEESSPAL